jgi:hypothetical protein
MSAAYSPPAKADPAERRAALWEYVKRRYSEGASNGLIAAETELRRNQVAWIVRKSGLQGTRGKPSEQLTPAPRNRRAKLSAAKLRARWADPTQRRAIMDDIARAYWSKTKTAKRDCTLIPAWLPDELEEEYRWWAMNDSEESAAAWAREAKRELARASA